MFLILSMYTERQKKLITSSERHTLKSTAFKWIIIGHRLAIILLTKHIKKNTFAWVKKNTIRWNCKRSFFKTHINCSPPGHRARLDNSQYGGYITRLWNWMNSYWMFSKGSLSWRFSVSVIFEKWPFAISSHFSTFWPK